MEEKKDWAAYYASTNTNPPSETALNAFRYLGEKTGLAVDLGCGAGTDSLYFLRHGWRVLAVDCRTKFIAQLKDGLTKEDQERFCIENMFFEELKLPEPADCIIANFSLPFCHPEHFQDMWQTISGGMKKDAIFSGVLFGDRDGWAEQKKDAMTFLSREQVMTLLHGFEILECKEEEFDGQCRGKNGEQMPKHWHLFRVVFKKAIS